MEGFVQYGEKCGLNLWGMGGQSVFYLLEKHGQICIS